MSDPGAGGAGGGCKRIFSVIAIVKGLPKAVVSSLAIEDVVTSCRLCRGPVNRGQEFCSQYCAHNYWGRLRQESGRASGNNQILLTVNSV